MTAPIVLINAVGLTPRLLPLAPRFAAIAKEGWMANMLEVLPAVTCTAQATLLTGKLPSEHGIVANGWLFRDTMEVRFWQQSNNLIQAEPLYATARKRAKERGKPFKSAKLFWWFNQGAAVDISVTPKPWYGADGNKVFDIATTPRHLKRRFLERYNGRFPFAQFWGPMSGLGSTQWIAKAAETTLIFHEPNLTLVYLPHLDYDPQRFGPNGCNMPQQVGELDDACEPILNAAKKLGAKVWIVSEYGHCDVTTPILPNLALRSADLLQIRYGAFGEQIDMYASRAFAVCDHQFAHVYVPNSSDIPYAQAALESLPGIGRMYIGEERAKIGLDNPRSGEIILTSKPHAWFAYPFWNDDRMAPDFARTIAIHSKPGFDPAELFFDPKLRFPKLHAARRLLQKKLGFRTLFDVVPLDPSIVRGSHGLAAANPLDRSILIGHGHCPGESVPMTDVRDLILNAMDLGERGV